MNRRAPEFVLRQFAGNFDRFTFAAEHKYAGFLDSRNAA